MGGNLLRSIIFSVTALDWNPILIGMLLRSRAEAASHILSSPPTLPVGKYAYSNTGYVLSAAMCEQAMGRTWEDLVSQEVWSPLQITEAGLGSMGSHGQVDQPWGHSEDGKVAGNGPEADNPLILGPAGSVHMPVIRLGAGSLLINCEGHEAEGDC